MVSQNSDFISHNVDIMSQNLYNFDFVDHFDLQVCNWNLVTQNLDFLIFFIIFFTIILT